MKKTKIVATLGPSTATVQILKDLIHEGVDGARLNFSHGDYESHGKMIEMLNQARKETGKPIALILDTKGPEIRLNKFKDGQAYLTAGNEFIITTEDVLGDETKVSTSYEGLPADVKEGDKILLDDGLIELVVKGINKNEIVCTVINGGTVKNNKGVNVPDTYINLPALTAKDIEDIKFGIKMEIDYIAASFIRTADDIRHIRNVLEENGGEHIKIISKIENAEGVKNVDDILDHSDGIMVARGDMGVEMPPEEVPIIQKELIRKSNIKGKLVITATQMLESMVSNPRPTRAEANDVANAIFDGTDCVMLSGETAGGKYPVEAVKMMSRIASTTEKVINYYKEIDAAKHYSDSTTNITDAIAYAACTVAGDIGACGIATATSSGFTARMVSKFRPNCPIIALTVGEPTSRFLNLYWGVMPVVADSFGTNDDITRKILTAAEDTNIAQNGDSIVIVAGFPIGIAGNTNTIKVSTVGDVLLKGKSTMAITVTARTCTVTDVHTSLASFKDGDIIVAERIVPELMPIMKKASAIIVGCMDEEDHESALTAGKDLEIPVIVCKENVVSKIQNEIIITIDSKKGIIYNGIREV